MAAFATVMAELNQKFEKLQCNDIKKIKNYTYEPLLNQIHRIRSSKSPNVLDRFVIERLANGLDELAAANVQVTLQHGSCRKKRFVVISDTHGHESRLRLPNGDVLLHCGDIIQNYGQSTKNLLKDFSNFLGWVSSIKHRFEKVVFIAGNHDTYLEPKRRGYKRATSILREFLKDNPNVVYLHHSSVRIYGITIWGGSAMPCRRELYNMHYHSNAFERTQKQREKIWKKIPPAHIIMTHTPPGKILAHRTGDSVLSNELYKNVKRRTTPSFHVFGHEHQTFGITHENGTVFINAAQDILLRRDGISGGCPLIFDCGIGSEGEWKWERGQRGSEDWWAFEHEMGTQLERDYQENRHVSQVRSSKGWQYDIDFMRMEQKNTRTHKVRRVRRLTSMS